MKKRKSPILLVTILIVLVSVVFAMNYKPAKGGDAHNHGPTADESAKPGAPREAPSLADLKKSKERSMAPMNPMSRASEIGMPDSAVPPSIENPEVRINKPVPNDSNVSTQWYTEEARKPK